MQTPAIEKLIAKLERTQKRQEEAVKETLQQIDDLRSIDKKGSRTA